MKSSAAAKSSFSPWPSSNVPALRPTPRKLKRSTAHADARQRLRRLIHRLGVHRAAVLRVRMREHRHGARRAVRQVEQRFERPDRARDLSNHVHDHHALGLRKSSTTVANRSGLRDEAEVPGALAAPRAARRGSGRDSAALTSTGTTRSSAGSPVTTSVGALTRRRLGEVDGPRPTGRGAPSAPATSARAPRAARGRARSGAARRHAGNAARTSGCSRTGAVATNTGLSSHGARR